MGALGGFLFLNTLYLQFAAATRPGWWIIAACGFVVIVLALITTGQRGRASAAKAASLVETVEDAAVRVPAVSREALASGRHPANSQAGIPASQ
jgi:hypothetical protein